MLTARRYLAIALRAFVYVWIAWMVFWAMWAILAMIHAGRLDNPVPLTPATMWVGFLLMHVVAPLYYIAAGWWVERIPRRLRTLGRWVPAILVVRLWDWSFGVYFFGPGAPTTAIALGLGYLVAVAMWVWLLFGHPLDIQSYWLGRREKANRMSSAGVRVHTVLMYLGLVLATHFYLVIPDTTWTWVSLGIGVGLCLWRPRRRVPRLAVDAGLVSYLMFDGPPAYPYIVVAFAVWSVWGSPSALWNEEEGRDGPKEAAVSMDGVARGTD